MDLTVKFTRLFLTIAGPHGLPAACRKSNKTQETSGKVLPAEPGAQVNPNESWIEEGEADSVEPGEPAPSMGEPE